jgi:L-threonylcarbamoyladenylate synthase
MWILRNGPITADQLREFGEVAVLEKSGNRPNAPGQLKSHYAPRVPLKLLAPGESPVITSPKNWGLLTFDGTTPAGPYKKVEVLSSRGDLREAASTLFAKMRALDNSGVEQIIAESVPTHGLGAAILDRLRKASGNG